jgi:hypothetical protein
MFPRTSRYYGIDTATYITAEGKEIVYLSRRFLPDLSSMTVFTRHTVTQGERLDNITARYLGDPEQFWKICDGNNALRPDDLTKEIGSIILIPMPKVG